MCLRTYHIETQREGEGETPKVEEGRDLGTLWAIAICQIGKHVCRYHLQAKAANAHADTGADPVSPILKANPLNDDTGGQ